MQRISIVQRCPLARLPVSQKPFGAKTAKETHRHQKIPLRGIGDDVVGSWLDLSKLVTSDASEHGSAFPEFAHDIGADVYVDINGWHLFLKDITVSPNTKLHSLIAQQLAPDLMSDGFNENQVTNFLKKVPLNIGGGKVKVSLLDAIPAYALNDFMKICKSFAEQA